jgi:hypothetical protein
MYGTYRHCQDSLRSGDRDRRCLAVLHMSALHVVTGVTHSVVLCAILSWMLPLIVNALLLIGTVTAAGLLYPAQERAVC